MLSEAEHRWLGELFGLDGRNAVVTGGAAGLGRAVAMLLAGAGANIAVADIDAEGAAAVVEEIRRTVPVERKAIAVATDVADPAAVAALFAAATQSLGPVDILVNVAGLTNRMRMQDTTVDQYDRIHAVNSRGTFLCMRAAIDCMKAGNGGSIINISSTASLRATTLHSSAYGASKASVNALTTAIALEVGAHDIRVNAVLPGGFPGERSARERKSGDVPTEGPIMQCDRIPLGRYGKQSELASVVLFLASPASSYVTGQLIAVDGGFLVS